jgi:DNA-binding SARP family transcriptional activator
MNHSVHRSLPARGIHVAWRLLLGALAVVALCILLAGLPWALCHFVGWPLPSQVPSLAEIEAVLLSPISARLVLDLLACLCWIIWAVFVVDVIRSAREAVRGLRDLRTGGPFRATARFLVAAIVLAVLGNRAAIADVRADPAAVITAPASLAPATADTMTVTDVVRPPQNGVHDSLWHMAARIWGDGTRWPELYTQNRGVPQPDGQVMIDPDHIRPGWQMTAQIPAPPPPEEPAPPSEPPPEPTAPDPKPPTSAAPSTPATADAAARDQAGPGIELATGAFVSLALAAVVGTTVATLRLRRRRRYRAGSGDRTDLQRPLGPVVRALAITAPPTSGETANQRTSAADPLAPPWGAKAGHQRTVDLASTGGIGLTGPGAASTARALLLHLLMAPSAHAPAQILVPTADLDIIGVTKDAPTPAGLVVVESPNAALDELEIALAARTRHAATPSSTTPNHGPLILLSRTTGLTERRLHSILHNGARLGLAAILLGQWQPGTTLRVDAAGIVNDTNRDPDLLGTRLYSLPADDTTQLLDLLSQAEQPANAPDTNVVDATTEPAPADEPVTGHTTPAEPPTRHDTPDPAILDLRVLGRLHLFHNGQDLIKSVAPKQKELLVYLALHPRGVRRDAIVADIWPDAPGRRPANSFHATLSQLRRALRTATADMIVDITVNEDGHYALTPTIVDVDLWRLRRTLGTDQPAAHILDLYQGDLANGLAPEWLLAPREGLRRDVLDALHAKATSEPDRETQLEILERMRSIDPYNEDIYRDIIRVQGDSGKARHIDRTLALLAATLDELGEQPEIDTVTLANQVKHAAVSRTGQGSR